MVERISFLFIPKDQKPKGDMPPVWNKFIHRAAAEGPSGGWGNLWWDEEDEVSNWWGNNTLQDADYTDF